MECGDGTSRRGTLASKATKGRRNIPEPERLKVWVRSGGCCAYCGKYLLEGAITHREFPLGELAHIVGQQDTPGSPRGQVVEMSDEDRDNAENLLLLCPGEHREIDREGAVEIIDIERLRKLKRDHEEWVRRVVTLDRNRGTAVLRMIGSVRGRVVEISRPTASDAVIRSDDRFPDFPLSYDNAGIEIDLRQFAGEDPANAAYWSACKAKIDEVVANKLNEAVAGEHIRHLSVFAFARLPLLVYLGSRLDDAYEVRVYQRMRDAETWRWPGGSTVDFALSMPEGLPGQEAVAILNVSGSIEDSEIPKPLRALPRMLIEPAGVTPAPDSISSAESLAAFEASVRGMFAEIERSNKDLQKLHVLAALPLSAAVTLGRVHDPHVHPAMVIYDRAAIAGGDCYVPAIEIVR
jgi:hypothetical protein